MKKWLRAPVLARVITAVGLVLMAIGAVLARNFFALVATLAAATSYAFLLAALDDIRGLRAANLKLAQTIGKLPLNYYLRPTESSENATQEK